MVVTSIIFYSLYSHHTSIFLYSLYDDYMYESMYIHIYIYHNIYIIILYIYYILYSHHASTPKTKPQSLPAGTSEAPSQNGAIAPGEVTAGIHDYPPGHWDLGILMHVY